MTVAELVKGVQFTIDQQGKTTAVVLEPDLWRRIMEALEDVEDRALVEALREHLQQGPARSGALRWSETKDQWQLTQ